MNRRIERVNELIKEEIATLLRRETQDPRLGSMISITAVETSRDLRNALVRVSIMGSEEETQQAMAGLRHAAGFLRRELSARIRIRQVPSLAFRLDTSIQQGSHVLDLLREIEKEG
jgi:ribosome-binding factor A